MEIIYRNVLFLVFIITVTSAVPCCDPGYVLNKDELCTRPLDNGSIPVALKCSKTVLVFDKTDANFMINSKGQLQWLLPNRIVTHEPDEFCDGLMERKHLLSRVALICDDKRESFFGDHVLGWSMLVSAVCLFVTAGWCCAKTHHRNLLGKSIINLCVSLAMGHGFLAVMRLVSYTDMNWCAVRGFSTYFFILASFFWMNAISLQILYERVYSSSDAETQKRHYAYYAAYSWGMPALFTIIMAIVNFMPGDHLKPGIGLNSCWFFDIGQQWQYMYSVMSLLLLINISIFISVIVSACCVRAAQESFEKKFGTCIRLFILMGIPFVFEMISTLTPPSIVWEIIDLLNGLQGVWFFIVLVLFRPSGEEEEHRQYNQNIVIASSVTDTGLPYKQLN